jgi:hypothetical protein
VDVVDGVEADEVDVEVETGADAEVEVDEEVVEVDVELVVGTVVDDVEVVEVDVVEVVEVDVELVVGAVVDDVEVVEVDVVEVVEVEVVEAVVEDEVEVEVADDDVEVDEVDVVDDEVEVVVVGTVVDDVEVVVEVDVVEVVDVDVDVVDVEVVVELVDVVELEVVDDEVEEVVEVDDVVVGTTLPPWISPTLISSATNVPRILALKRLSVAGFSSAQSWATTTVVGFAPTPRVGGRPNLHVVVASGTGRPAAGCPEMVSASWVPPAMLTESCLPLTSTRRSCGVPPALICELGRTSKESTTSSTLGAAVTTWLPLFVVTLQKT